MTMKIKEQAESGKARSSLINHDHVYTCRHMYNNHREETTENIKHNI